ncbi:MAG: hypothetical protein Tsb0015_16710 [Simkaniaceae bacterium]
MSDSEKKSSDKLLGDYTVEWAEFENVDEYLKILKKPEFKNLNEKQKLDKASYLLYQCIQKAKKGFLLKPIVSFIQAVRKEALPFYSFSHFELWMNQFSDLNLGENYRLRGKITGRYIPRDAYQIFFPVGMDKYYNGTHFVTAHASPDIDTTIASFWGWIDAFSAQVSDGLHIWNVPGGLQTSQVEISMLFTEILGEAPYKILMRTRQSLTLSSIDIMTQRGMVKKYPYEHALSFEHDRQMYAVVLIDENGFYLGDWRSIDVEGIRQVIMLFNSCLRWLESHLHVTLISMFAKKELYLEDLPKYIRPLMEIRFRDCEPAKEFTLRQLKFLQNYLVKVLGIEKGLDCTFSEFAKEMEDLSIADFTFFQEQIETLKKPDLFDQEGRIKENRPLLFERLEKVIKSLSLAFRSIRLYVEKLEVALKIKTDVFKFLPQYLTNRTDVEEIKTKMDGYPYLTVNLPDSDGKLLPLGVIHSTDLQKDYLGTVTLRDFCNRDETKVPNYLEVISVIDHHKSTITTKTPPVAYISDSQSANALVADLSFQINDQYSTGGMTLQQIDEQLQELGSNFSEAKTIRIHRRLLKRKMNAQRNGGYYVTPDREYMEYRHYLYAILDDTDLLTKVSKRDVQCVKSLMNRMKSLSLRKEVEIIDFDDIPDGPDFAQKAAKKLLQNDDLYSLYRKVYESKEQLVEENLVNCIEGRPSPVFADTKIQNECCRVGQTKIFAKNYPVLEKYIGPLRNIWVRNSKEVFQKNEIIDLHLHMISTIASAEEMYRGKKEEYLHQDELWIWIPETDISVEHLKLFLSAFKKSPALVDNEVSVEILSSNASFYKQVFRESFLQDIPVKVIEEKEEEIPIAVLKYRAGSVNSRKAMVSPFLPKLSSST